MLSLGLSLLLAAQPLHAQDEPAVPAVDQGLAECLQQAQLVYEADPDGDCRLLLEYESGRSQQVFVSSRSAEVAGWELREIWSVAGMGDALAKPETMELLLRANSAEEVGAWAYRQVGEAPALVFRLQAPAACDPFLLRRLVGLVGRSADDMEQSLGNGDEF
jgi:hypothetical protein